MEHIAACRTVLMQPLGIREIDIRYLNIGLSLERFYSDLGDRRWT